MKLPAVIIVSEEAEAYQRLLAASLPEGVALSAHRDAAEAAAAWSGQAVALGEPHLLAGILPGMPAVRWVQSTWAGIKPLLPAARAGIAVTGVKGVFGPQMAEFVLGYLLAFELRLLERVDRQVERQWWPEDNGGLQGRTLGIMGTGSIGAHIAMRCRPFGLRLLGFSRSGDPAEPFERVYGRDGLDDFLGQLDYLVTVLPDTPETDGLLSAAALAALRPGAVLVNVGRGSVLDEDALADALHARHLRGAVLDVFRSEPLPDAHRFWDTPNLLLTAHVAARSYPRDIARIFADNYRRFTAGEPLSGQVDPQRGY